MTRYATLPICTAVRATRKTPPAIPTPIASQMRIAPSMDIDSFSAGKPPLERLELALLPRERPRRTARHVVLRRRSVDERREMRADRRWQLRDVSEVRRDVGEVLHRIGVIALA